MKSSVNRSSVGSWGKGVISVVAGLIAFAAAAYLSSGRTGLGPGESDVVGAVKRFRPQAEQNGIAPTAITRQAERLALPSTFEAQRLTDQVASNPFGPLNLKAGTPANRMNVAPAASAAASQPALKDTVAKPQEPPAPLPPPTPMAPPLPFTVIGAISGSEVTEGQLVAFVKQQDQLLLIRAGDAIGQTYRVESISPQKIEFTYLPLMQRQALVLAQ